MERPAEIFEIARILLALRERLDYSQEDMAPLLAMTQSHYSKVEKARLGIKAKNIDRLAKDHPKEAEQLRVLMARASGLVTGDPENPVPRPKTPKEGFYPVVGGVSAGTFEELIEAGRRMTGERDTRPAPTATKAKRAYWIEASGDSMCGKILSEDGDVTIIRSGDMLFVEDLPPVSGKPALVEREGELTVKLWRKHKDGSVELVPANTAFKTIQVDSAREVRAWRITWHDPKPRQL